MEDSWKMAMSFVKDLEKFRITTIPPKVYYIPDFITESEEQSIISNFNNAPKPKWTQLLNRRLQNWGGIPHPKGMIAEDIPNWLKIHLNNIKDLNLMNGNTPNHILANEYQPNQGIMAHTDGPLFYPTITTISCGSHIIINFTHKDTKEKHSILLERRSLFIVQELLYHDYLHSIEELESDCITEDICNIKQCSIDYNIGDVLNRNTRISLTIRHVPKTSKIKIKI